MNSFENLAESHSATLEAAASANRSREFYAHWPEAPSGKIYGENANAEGLAEFQSYLNKPFKMLGQEDANVFCGEEISPYGFPLGITYPNFNAKVLVARAKNAMHDWLKLSPDNRAYVLLECLEQAAKHFYAIGYATMHTTGQGFVMAFQASGPHAFDRALEAIVMSGEAQKMFAARAEWKKPMGRMEIVLDKRFHIVPKGVNLTIGCSTFPVWNSLPGMFASLAAGNATIAKTHHGAILPMAICVASFRQTLAEMGLNPDLIQLAADISNMPQTLELAKSDGVALIDYTGGTAFGKELEKQISGLGKQLYTEKAGVNCVIIDSVENIDAALENLAFSLTLYSGQMCTAPQNIFIPQSGAATPDAILSPADIARRLAEKIDALVCNDKIGPGTLGAIQNEATVKRVEEAAAAGEVVRASSRVVHAGFNEARSASPLLVMLNEEQRETYEREWFGPISFIIPTASFDTSVEIVESLAKSRGALSSLIYTTDADKKNRAEEALVQVGTPTSFNLTGPIWVNQSAAFSDFHGTGANPAGSASFADLSFVSSRFAVVGSRSK